MQRLVDAAIDILKNDGFERLGVNAIAERAAVSKILIYRYFGGLSGLLRAVGAELDPLQSKAADELLQTSKRGSSDSAAPPQPGDVIENVVMKLHEAMNNDDLTKQLLIWELNRHNDVTATMSEVREEIGLSLTERFARLLLKDRSSGGLDINALFAVITAAVTYLTLRSDVVSEYNGIDIHSKEGWSRIASTLKLLVDAALPEREPQEDVTG